MAREPSSRIESKNRRWLAFLAAVVALAILAFCAFRNAGRWLVREDTLVKADEIYVLSGKMPERAEEAADLFKRGYAPQVWISRPRSPLVALNELGIRYIPEEEYSRQILIREGVPESAIRILPEVIENTEQEVQAATSEMRKNGDSRIIIVTSPEHSRRVRILWTKIAGKYPYATIHGSPQDPFDPDHWWRHTQDALSVVREYLGLLNAWVGLPIKP
jgi:uncharacterized SAM-binding protein YcdF (DUF218 family)